MWWTSTSYIDFSQRVGIDPLRHRQVALRVHVAAEHAVALLGKGHGEVERGRGLGDAALLVGERDHLGGGRQRGSDALGELIRACIRRQRRRFLPRGRRTRRSMLPGRARTARPPPDLRHRQGRRGQVDRGHRARAAGRAPRAAHDRRRAGQPGPASATPSSTTGSVFEEVELGARPVHDLDRPPARDGGVPAGQGRAASARRSARAACFRPSRWPPRGCASCSASARCGSSPSSSAGPSGADAYDLVIVDAPATGHGVGILRTPRTFAEIARVGPIAHQGRRDRGHDRRPATSPAWSPWPPPRRCRSTRR